MKINEIRVGMRKITLYGKITDMNPFMIVLEDSTGKAFVRYRSRNVIDPIKIGDYVTFRNGRVVEYSGIIQIRVEPSGRIIPITKAQAELHMMRDSIN